MNIEDLMIGDWVSIKGKPCKVAVLRSGNEDVRTIGVESELGVLYYQEGYVEPIILTPENLKKNGWLDGDYLFYNEFKINFYLINYGESFGVNIGYDYSRREFAIIKYVHEFQHLLRLCGLSELANGFEV